MVKVRKGFTLVELLIVIVIIGILAAAMLLSSGAATASAEASTIISDLRSMKAAALMLYADSMDVFENTTYSLTVNYLTPYVDNPAKYTIAGSPYGLSVDSNERWWVYYNLSNKSSEVKSKLQGRAQTTGLLKSTNLTDSYTTASNTVWMVAR
ncbi:MAG: prepilin-type N-terminal cleavage/methylation domain-containing protein [Synergistaceae bacterium]|jgi:general secretion pathway protein G|nr:prepilin-type N-terminal cleavage/methylation domain-containing protein [Synergistaceae bacterium]